MNPVPNHRPLGLVGQADSCAWCFETWPCSNHVLRGAVTALREIADCHYHGPGDGDDCEVCRIVIAWLDEYDERERSR